jgi:hypothetical protein
MAGAEGVKVQQWVSMRYGAAVSLLVSWRELSLFPFSVFLQLPSAAFCFEAPLCIIWQWVVC